MPNRQPPFAPGDHVFHRIPREPWLVAGTIESLGSDWIAVIRYRVGIVTEAQITLLHRDGDEFRAWRDAFMVLRNAEAAVEAERRARFPSRNGRVDPTELEEARRRCPSCPALVRARAALRPASDALFAVHPVGLSR